MSKRTHSSTCNSFSTTSSESEKDIRIWPSSRYSILMAYPEENSQPASNLSSYACD